MSTNTPNLGLVQPQLTDKVSDTITALSTNMQTIDAAVTSTNANLTVLQNKQTTDEANIATNTTAINTINTGGLDTRYYTQSQTSSMLNNATKTTTIQAGTAFPTGTFTDGQLFWRSDLLQMFAWSVLINGWVPADPGNTTSHGPALNSVWNFESDVYSSRGLLGTFTRATSANDPNTLATVASGKPRLTKGKYGNGIMIEEGTTNLVYNSDFETVTSTAVVFSDGLTSGAAWATKTGSFTFAAGGATSGAVASFMTAGNAAWKPLTGSGGQNLAITEQATFTTSTTVAQTDSNGRLRLYADANDYYGAYLDATGANFVLSRTVAGVTTQLATVAQAITASTAYTITLSLDNAGHLTAKLYSGTGTGGTLLQTLTATDTSLTGGFLIGVGGDSGVVVSGAQVMAAIATSTSYTGAAVTNVNTISGAYSVHIGANGSLSLAYGTATIVPNTQYTFSAIVRMDDGGAPNVTTSQTSGDFSVAVNNGIQTAIVTSLGNNLYRISVTYTYGATVNSTSFGVVKYASQSARGFTVDCLQFEQKAYATSYLRNDSTSSTATRNAETLTVPSSVLNSAAGTISMWAYEDGAVNLSTRHLFSTDGGWLGVYKYNGKYYTHVNSVQLSVPSANIPVTGWHMYTLKWSGTSLTLYVDGAVVAANTSATAVSFVGATTLYMCSSNGGANQWNNVIDDLAIFNRALTDAEVAALFNSPVPLNDLYRANTWTRIPNRPSSLVRQNLFRGSFGTTSTTNVQPTVTTAGVFQFKYNAAEWSNTSGFILEPYFATTTGGTAYVGLWDVTSAAAVSGTEVLSPSATNSSIRSGTFTLTDGHIYSFYVRTSNASYTANVYGVDLLTILN